MYSYIHIQTEIECRLFISNTDYGTINSDGKRYIFRYWGDIVVLRCVEINNESNQFHTIVKGGDSIYIKKPDFKKTVLTSVSERIISIGTKDRRGVIYSGDGSILLKCTNKNVRRYKIKDGCSIICDSAFEGCEKLRKIVLPDSLTHIGNCAFKDCINANFVLSNVVKNKRFQNSNTKWWKMPILQILSLPFVVFFELVLSDFDFNIFNSHSILPKGVKHIGNMAFYRCKKIFDISLPDNIEYIGEHAFEDCESLTYINLPKHITFIAPRVLSFCSNIHSIKIPEDVKYICDGAFWNCFRLSSVEIPNNVLGIGNRAFHECSKMKEINIEQKGKIVHDVEKCDNQYWPITFYTFNLSVVGEDAFSYSCLTSIQIPPNSMSHFESIIPSNYHYLLKEKTR